MFLFVHQEWSARRRRGHPEQGGSIKLLVDGPADTSVSAFTPGPHMFDNIAVSESGQVFLEEEFPGNNAYIAKQWLYDIESGKLVQIAQHDPARFAAGAPWLAAQDEESSGVIDAWRSSGRAGTCSTRRPISRTAARSPSRVASCRRSTSRPGQIKQLFE